MANLSNINNKFIVTDGGNVLIGNTANSSGRLQIKDTQTSSFNDGLAITRNNAAQTGYINMVGGAFNFNSPGLSYKFRNNGTQTLELNSSGNSTFAGMVTVNGGGIDIDNNDDVRLRFDNASVFKAGLQVATTAGDMIAGSAVNDFAIRSQENMLFATGGNTERMRITSGGGVSIGSTNPSLDTSLRVFKAGVSVQARIGESNSAYSTLGQNSLIRFQGRNTYSTLANTASVYGDIGLDVDNQLLIFNDPGTTGGSVGTNPMVLDAAGNLGIGTTSPSAKLEVRGTAPTYTNSSTVFWGGTTNNDSHNGIMLSSYGDALGGSLASNLLYSNSNTPTQTNTNRSSGQIKFGNTTVAAKTSDINFGGYYKGTTTFVERMRIDNSGNVGIGTTKINRWK